jgi:hypothetical protein
VGEQVQQRLLGDADAAADAECVELAAGDGLVELVAADPQDLRGLADGEHFREAGEGHRSGAGGSMRASAAVGGEATGVVAGVVGGSPSVGLLARFRSRCLSVCRAVGCGGGGTIPRSSAQV